MKRNPFILVLILGIFFLISFITNILGPILPGIIDNFGLSLGMAAFLPFSFFLAYGVMSIPAGMLTERFGEKPTMLAALVLIMSGSLLFACFPEYGMALASLFVIGIGMAMLQVVINPLLRVVGGEEHFAFNAVLAQLVFGAASFISPFVFSSLVLHLAEPGEDPNVLIALLGKIVPGGLHWVSLYWIFALLTALVVIIVSLARLPRVNLTEEERAGTFRVYIELFKDRKVILFFLGILAYVGTEQGLANWMSKFLQTYHGLSPETEGAAAVAWFWGLMSVGCLLGLVLLKLMDSRTVLRLFGILAMLSVGLALFGSASLSRWAFPASGFFISVMYSIIFSLALNSVPSHHGAFSGILCSGIFGGALVPLVIGWIGDQTGLRLAMLTLYITLGYIVAISFWARPLVNNKTVRLNELFPKNKD